VAHDKEWDISEAAGEPGVDGSAPDSAGNDEGGRSPSPSEDAAGERDLGGSDAAEEHAAESTPEPSTAPEHEPGMDGEHQASAQKRPKRASRRELLDLIQKKNTMLNDLAREVKTTKEDLVKKEDRLLRLAAEFENYRKRTQREWELLKRKSNADLIGEIIVALDNFDRAFANLGGNEDGMQEGLRLIHSGLMDVLKKAGLRELEAMKERFDPLYHEAAGEIESEDIDEGHVAQVVQKGYSLNDIVIRPARVIVARRKG